MNLLEMKNVKKSFGDLQVLKDISLTVADGEIVSIIGQSGSGKSTLLRCATLLETMDAGTLKYEDTVVADNASDGRAAYADKETLRKIKQVYGLVFQQFNLFPHWNVLQNVTDAVIHVQKKSREEAEKIGRELLEKMGLADKEKYYPYQLSGGQQQRVAIARALANDPQVLLCDEATSALDPQTTKAILHLLKHLNETLGITIVLITHEMAVVKEICDRVAVMEYGRVVEQGEVFTVFAEPKQDITKSFIHTTSNLQKVEELIAEDSPVTRLQPGELIVRLSYVQRNVNEPIISAVSQMFNVSLNIIFADITIVQDSPIGGTVAIISGERKQITKAIEYLIEKNVGVEVIKDARADR